MPAIGVAGTAKNTGKTTVLRALLAAATAAGWTVALTGIGYDGEELDHITGLPKPRIAVPAGTWLATAGPALAGQAGFEVAAATSIRTAVGRVALARAVRPGRAVLAGPATAQDLGEILERLRALGAGLILVDGALSRVAPLTAVDGLVIATGAARHPDAGTLARETAAIAALFRLPVRAAPEGMGARGPGGEAVLPYPALLDPKWADELAAAAAAVAATTVSVPGSVNCQALRRLGERLPATAGVVFSHPLHLLASAEPQAVAAAVAALGGRAAVRRALPLIGFTLNPFYPVRAGDRYRGDRVDARELLAEVRAAVDGPVTDVFLEGPEVLWDPVHRLAQNFVRSERGMGV